MVYLCYLCRRDRLRSTSRHSPKHYQPMQNFFEYNLVDNIDVVRLDAQNGEHIVRVVNCLNPHSFVTALDDAEFKSALAGSDYVLPDGVGVCKAMRWFGGVRIGKIAGDDIHRHLLRQVAERGGRVFYMGSSEEVLKGIVERLKREYPGVEVRTLSPSYCERLSEEESSAIVAKVNEFGPDVLFVSMTAPKQEKWVARYREQLTGVQMIASIGAVFEFYGGGVRRAPKWMVSIGLEWLWRLVREPRRMWRRVFVSGPRFVRWVRRHRSEL